MCVEYLYMVKPMVVGFCSIRGDTAHGDGCRVECRV